MHTNFADWYREADLKADSDILENRYTAIKNYSENIDEAKCLNLVRLLLGHTVDEAFINEFTKYFSDVDTAFPTRDNLFELSVLSGATIVNIIEVVENYDYIIALATLTGSFLPHSDNPPVSDIIFEAQKFLNDEAESLRSNLLVTSSSKITSNKKIITALEKNRKNIADGEVEDHNELGAMFNQAISETVNQLTILAKEFQKTTKKMSTSINLLSEETNILWWIFGEYSRDLNVKMSSFEPEAVCVIAGKELTDLIDTPPGPLSVDAFLTKIMESGRSDIPDKVTLKDAINKSPKDWREQWVKDRKIENMICPIHFAAKTSLLTEDDDSWGSVYKKSTGDFLLEKTPLDFAKQLYWEGLLIKILVNGD